MKRDNELYVHRRHLRDCPFFGPGGRGVRTDKCKCPFHVDGTHAGERVRSSLRTRSRQLADRRLADLIRKRDDEIARKQELPSAEPAAAQQRTISEAVERFRGSTARSDGPGRPRGDSEHGTFRIFRGCLRRLESFCAAKGFRALGDVGPDELEDFRATRRIQPVTWKVERQMLVTFFRHCLSRKWTAP